MSRPPGDGRPTQDGEPGRRDGERPPVALGVRLAFRDLAEFVDRYAVNIGGEGVFIRSRDPRPVGTRISFELRLQSGVVAFAGVGTVRRVERPAGGGPEAPGMGLEFDLLTAESEVVLARILQARAETALPPACAAATRASWSPLELDPPLAAPAAEPAPVPAPRPPAAPPRIGLFSSERLPARPPPRPAVGTARPPMGPPARPEPPRSTPVLVPGPVAAPPASARPAGVMASVSTRGAAAAASVGLDLGWSTLRAALAREEAVQPLLLDGSAWPLMVAVQGGSLVAGAEAVRAGAQGAPSARGLAMLLGASLEDASVRAWRRREAFSVEAGESGLRVRSGRAALDPVELVTGLLAEVRAAASREAGGEVRRAALAVPPGLLPRRRRALREAAEAAGFEVVRLVPAPAAALLAHHGPFGHRRVLVFDFGEGSCAATVVEQSGNALEVVGHAGDAELGGVELDLALVDALLTQFEKESGLLVPEDPAVFVRVRDEAARTKIALGDTTELEVQLRDLVPAGLSRADLYQRVPRARLLTLAAPLLDRALALCRIALAAGSFGGADLDEILISGGQGRLPAMVHMLAEKLGKEPVRPERPEWLAATGAALLCEGERRAGRYRTTSVAGASLGVVGRGGALRRVIDRSQPLPVERSYTAVTTTDGETRLELPIFVGDEPRAADNDCEGTVLVGPLPPAPRGEVRIAVKLALSESGELTVRARNAATGRELPCVLGPGRAARDG